MLRVRVRVVGVYRVRFVRVTVGRVIRGYRVKVGIHLFGLLGFRFALGNSWIR